MMMDIAELALDTIENFLDTAPGMEDVEFSTERSPGEANCQMLTIRTDEGSYLVVAKKIGG